MRMRWRYSTNVRMSGRVQHKDEDDGEVLSSEESPLACPDTSGLLEDRHHDWV